ncbi:type II toxin-antitoxin system prevent-host-death family antitoxin [Amphiplicatus metriothermophilus]|uniref:Antitoxin n=1 Tax=Amphiplicatus metriothermophilus TaxID=1519374 RepID=A0A239PQK8_9PROT|nr:type II toxin-antitoxin system prevent-host-death family antitoxin [Amphiplicatus metriothermophilus]MBB5518646.1 prevent-host-death family protein [Amphiplicatus metriothermophilus]SNT72196.1 prevent-host-death family protein [Amphiplicatus metriothermophilus]
MSRVAAVDAKNRFGELLNAALREPVTVEKHGKPVAVVVSKEEYDELLSAKLALLKIDIERGLADIEAGRTLEGEAVMKAARARLRS